MANEYTPEQLEEIGKATYLYTMIQLTGASLKIDKARADAFESSSATYLSVRGGAKMLRYWISEFKKQIPEEIQKSIPGNLSTLGQLETLATNTLIEIGG